MSEYDWVKWILAGIAELSVEANSEMRLRVSLLKKAARKRLEYLENGDTKETNDDLGLSWFEEFQFLHLKSIGYEWTEKEDATLDEFEGDTPEEAIERLIWRFDLTPIVPVKDAVKELSFTAGKAANP